MTDRQIKSRQVWLLGRWSRRRFGCWGKYNGDRSGSLLDGYSKGRFVCWVDIIGISLAVGQIKRRYILVFDKYSRCGSGSWADKTEVCLFVG